MELLERDPLLDALRASRTGGALVFVSGEAGIGKSALVRRFCDELPAATAVYLGYCDALATPRASGPLHDIARADPDGLARLLAAGADRHTVFTAFLDLITAGPSVTVIEDAHWADEATLDLLVFVGRRIGGGPATVVVTYRADEIGRDHPLRRVLGDLATARSVLRLPVPALSVAAVAELVGDSGRDGAELHSVTGGNPFFVTEALATPAGEVPATVRDAVMGRVNRWDADVRAVLDVVSLVPARAEAVLLGDVTGASPAVLDAAVRSGMLVAEGPTVRFRHELARRAVEADVPVGRGIALHGRILAHLAATDTTDPARLAYHAEAAGDADAVVRHATDAGLRAMGLGAHREAAAHFDRALRHAVGTPADQRAELCELRADACNRSGELSDALDASARALDLWHAAGDVEREAGVLARRSHVLWNAARGAEAHHAARAAVALLEPLQPTPGLAQALAARARLLMLARHDAAAIAVGFTAITCAERFGDTATLGRALNAVGSAHWSTDPDRAVELLTAGLEASRRVGDDMAVAACLNNLGSGAGESGLFALADRWLAEAVVWCTERDLDSSLGYALAWRARSHVEQGRWAEATTDATAVVDTGSQHMPSQIVALTVLGRLRARRGDPDAHGPLDRAWELAQRTGDLQRLWPVAAARAEAAWLSGASEGIEEMVAGPFRLAVELANARAMDELGYWLWRAGAGVARSGRTERPFALERDGEWAAAAASWRALGCPYEAAVAVAGGDDPDQQLGALGELQRLGAWPAAEMVARRLRDGGVRALPRRPRRATRDNPAQLTDRQLEVLDLLAEGLRNAGIAARLHISEKTVDHHVSAVLAKLGVGSRQEAARWASAHRDG